MRALLLATALVSFASLAAPARAAEPDVLRFGAGSKTGGFTKIGEALQAGLEDIDAPFALDIQHTAGSCENIQSLLRGELDFGLVQYDVAAEAFKASRVSAEDDDEDDGLTGGYMCQISSKLARGADLRVIGALTDGAVHMLVRRPVRLNSLDALGDHPIYIGKDGSGSFETGKVIVGAAGKTVEELNALQMGSSEAFEAMHRGELLVMVRTTERGDAGIAKLIASGVASVNPLPDDVLNRLIDGYPYYRVCQIEPKTYPGLEFGLPTVCVSTVLLTRVPAGDDAEAARLRARNSDAVEAMLGAIRSAARDPKNRELGIKLAWRGFAEQEPIPLHAVSEEHEFRKNRNSVLAYGGLGLFVIVLIWLLRRYLKRRGIIRDGLNSTFEGHLSNPLVPFAAFAILVMISTVIVWSIEHDSNAHLRTLDDSFWEINTFATGNFSAETVKTSTARFIGAVATIAGLGFLAWFTAALTNLFGRDQTRLFQRLRGHVVILNFREDMLPLIRLLRAPGPTQIRSIHVVVSDNLPKRVRLHLAKIKGLTIHHQNPEVPDDIAELRLPRAARVVVLQGDLRYGGKGLRYHPLRITRAVHQACGRDVRPRPMRAPDAPPNAAPDESGVLPAAQTTLATTGHRTPRRALPTTLVEAGDHEPRELFDPFRGWVIPVRGRELADNWLATASHDPGFAQLFHDLVSFDEDNSEVYTAEVPSWFVGKPWRLLRRVLYRAQNRGGAIPVGLFRGRSNGANAGAELERRLLANPPLATEVLPGDRVVAICEDEADLIEILQRSEKLAEETAKTIAGA